MTTSNNKSNNKKPKVNIDGPRLAGTNDLPKDKLLKLVTRGLGHPVRETLLIWNWESGPVINVVFSMDWPRLAGTNDLPNDKLLYDSAIEADKVFFNTIPFIFVDFIE